MALVQLSNIFIRKVYTDIVLKDSTQKLALMKSGIITQNPVLDAKAKSGEPIIEMPLWNDLNRSSEPNYSTDDPTQKATPQNVDMGSMLARMAYMNNGWSAADLATEIGNNVPDPMTRIKTRTSSYWDAQFQKRLIAMSKGVLAKNVASNSGDMVYNIAIEDGNAATEDNLINRSAVVRALFTLGDAFDTIKAIALHSAVYSRLVDQEQIQFLQPAGIGDVIPTYLGKRVLIDDDCPAVAGGTSGVKYTTTLYGAGAFGYGEGTPEVPVEVKRDPDAGNGAGIETLWERKTWLLHPFGHSFLSASVSGGQTATLANLANANNWLRVMDRKQIPLAFLITNG